jgi:hypothetical protein
MAPRRIRRASAGYHQHGANSDSGVSTSKNCWRGGSWRYGAGPTWLANCSKISENLLEARARGLKEEHRLNQDRLDYFQAKGGTRFWTDRNLPLARLTAAGDSERSSPPVETCGCADQRHHKNLNALAYKPASSGWDLYYRLNVIEIAVPALRAGRAVTGALLLGFATSRGDAAAD